MSNEPLTDDEVRALGYEPTSDGWRPIPPRTLAALHQWHELARHVASGDVPFESRVSGVRLLMRAAGVADGPEAFDAVQFGAWKGFLEAPDGP